MMNCVASGSSLQNVSVQKKFPDLGPASLLAPPVG